MCTRDLPFISCEIKNVILLIKYINVFPSIIILHAIENLIFVLFFFIFIDKNNRYGFQT